LEGGAQTKVSYVSYPINNSTPSSYYYLIQVGIPTDYIGTVTINDPNHAVTQYYANAYVNVSSTYLTNNPYGITTSENRKWATIDKHIPIDTSYVLANITENSKFAADAYLVDGATGADFSPFVFDRYLIDGTSTNTTNGWKWFTNLQTPYANYLKSSAVGGGKGPEPPKPFYYSLFLDRQYEDPEDKAIINATGMVRNIYFYYDETLNLAPEPDPVNITMSYQADDSGFAIARQPFEVLPGLSESYGYTDEFNGAEASVLDAIVAAHIAEFGDDTDVIHTKLTFENGFASNFMGDNAGNLMFSVDGEIPMFGADTVSLTENALVELFSTHGTYPNLDIYTRFAIDGETTETAAAVAGVPLKLNISGTFWEDVEPWGTYLDIIPGAAIVPVSFDVERGSASFGEPLAVTDAEGNATVTFPKGGTYILSAIDALQVTPILSPWLEVTVEPALGQITDVLISNGQLLGNINYNADTTPTYSVKDRQFDAVVEYGQASGQFTINVGGDSTVDVSAGSAVQDGAVWNLTLPSSVEGTTTTVSVSLEEETDEYAFTCYTQAYSGMPLRVAEYIVPGSQYTNGFNTLGPYGLNGVATLRGVNINSATTVSAAQGPASLGNFGGYIIYEYAAPIIDDPANPYGIDFIVFGNSFAGSPGLAEPGNVLVSYDGISWYTLAGSLHYDDNAHWNVSKSYTSGSGFPDTDKYPLFNWGGITDTLTFSGTELIQTNGSSNAPYPAFGYADVGKMPPTTGDNNVAANPYTGLINGSTDRTDGFDLKWAVDAAGQPVELPNGVKYIKIQTATGIDGGAIGEKSTEVNGMRVAKANSAAVEKTSAPASVTIARTAFDTSASSVFSNVKVPLNGSFNVKVDTQAANVYINSIRGKSASFTRAPDHGILRVIVQDGEKEPWIGYFNLTEDAGTEAIKSSVITFNLGKGTTDGDTIHTFTEGSNETFPADPTWDNRTFLGWYDANNTKYTGYVSTLPAVLTLTAKWQYNTPGGSAPSATVNVTFRLIGAEKSPSGGAYQNWIKTKAYSLPAGSTMYDLFVSAIAEAGLTQTGAQNNYVSAITAPAVYGGLSLAEMDNGVNSGWMYTVNGKHADRGLVECDLKNGDTVIWHFVNNYALEIEDWFEGTSGTAADWNKWLLVADNNPSINEAAPSASPEPSSPDSPSAPGGNTGGGSTPETPASPAAPESPEPPAPADTAKPGETVSVEVPAATVTKSDDGSITARVDVTTETVTKAISEAVKAIDGKTDTIAEVKIVVKAEEPKAGETAEKVTSAEVELVVEAVKEIAAAKDLVLTIESDVATITLDSATLDGISENKADGDTVKITASEVETALIELTVTVGDTVIHDFRGEVRVQTPYTPPVEVKTEDYDLLTVYYVDDSGKLSEIPGAYFDIVTRQIVFTTTHFSRFMVAEWISPFSDIAKSDWYYKIARFSYSNSLIEGIDGNFEAARKLTRGQMFTLLAKYAGVDTSGGAQWYSKGVDWAVAQGISDGTAPERQITRGEMFQLLYNLAKTQGIDVSGTADLSAYPDASEASAYTQAGLNWALSAGLASGDENGKINPKGIATRVGIAGILKNYIEKVK
jgi:hypothetical protein